MLSCASGVDAFLRLLVGLLLELQVELSLLLHHEALNDLQRVSALEAQFSYPEPLTLVWIE
jgi:hypothetical protein